LGPDYYLKPLHKKSAPVRGADFLFGAFLGDPGLWGYAAKGALKIHISKGVKSAPILFVTGFFPRLLICPCAEFPDGKRIGYWHVFFETNF
jgi:hypothetical protein